MPAGVPATGRGFWSNAPDSPRPQGRRSCHPGSAATTYQVDETLPPALPVPRASPLALPTGALAAADQLGPSRRRTPWIVAHRGFAAGLPAPPVVSGPASPGAGHTRAGLTQTDTRARADTRTGPDATAGVSVGRAARVGRDARAGGAVGADVDARVVGKARAGDGVRVTAGGGASASGRVAAGTNRETAVPGGATALLASHIAHRRSRVPCRPPRWCHSEPTVTAPLRRPAKPRGDHGGRDRRGGGRRASRPRRPRARPRRGSQAAERPQSRPAASTPAGPRPPNRAASPAAEIAGADDGPGTRPQEGV